jgi:hypothetical protein
METATGHPLPQARGIHIRSVREIQNGAHSGDLGRVGVRSWRTPGVLLAQLVSREREVPRSRQFNVGRVFMSPIAVDPARPLIQGKLIPYLYELIHNQASCLVFAL